MSSGTNLPPSFAYIAAHLGVWMCTGINPESGLYCELDHWKGSVTPAADHNWIVHWQERRLGRPGVRTFLKMISIRDREVREATGWRRTYLANIWAYWTALDVLNMRLPAALFDKDRAIVLAQLEAEPDSLIKKAARAWAQQ